MSCKRQSQIPTCVSPSSSRRPSFSYGSGSGGAGMMRYGGLGYGRGMSSGFGYGGGMSSGFGYGGGMSSGSLGLVPGVTPSCVSQVPSSEVVIQPPPFVLTIPGPIMAASCEPMGIGCYSPCASGSGMGSQGMGSLGMGSQGMGSLGMGSQGMGSLGMGSSQGYLGGGCSGTYGSKRRSSFCYYPY